MEHESTATAVDPDLPLLLRVVETLRIPEDTMDQGDWLLSVGDGRMRS
jgi:hypothetical protein